MAQWQTKCLSNKLKALCSISALHPHPSERVDVKREYTGEVYPPKLGNTCVSKEE